MSQNCEMQGCHWYGLRPQTPAINEIRLNRPVRSEINTQHTAQSQQYSNKNILSFGSSPSQFPALSKVVVANLVVVERSYLTLLMMDKLLTSSLKKCLWASLVVELVPQNIYKL